jgi:hypothetical protein
MGVSWATQQRRIANGFWYRYGPGVIGVAGAPATFHQRAMAATLRINGLALVSGRSAARLHRFDGFADVPDVEITVAGKAHIRSSDDLAIRFSRRLTEKDRHIVDGIPVAIQPLTLIQLAADGWNAAKALDSALRQGKPPLWFRQHFERYRRPGVSGPSTMLSLLDDRMGRRLPRSWFQRLASRIFVAHGIDLVDEHPVFGPDGTLLAELDLADVQHRVGVECQSIHYHATGADFSRDIQRKRILRQLGWEIVELWWTDLDRMDDVLAEFAAAVARQRRA